jgi:hypothetical protein
MLLVSDLKKIKLIKNNISHFAAKTLLIQMLNIFQQQSEHK